MDDIFKAIKPILNSTVNWRSKGFKRFWTAALKYASNGEIPEFKNTLDSHLDDTFNEFKKIVDQYKANTVKSMQAAAQPQSNQVDSGSNKEYLELLDNLSYESDFFTDVERTILIDMLKQSRNRSKVFYATPFIYTTTRVSQLGFPYTVFYALRNKLELLDMITYESKTLTGYTYPVTFYRIDEEKLGVFTKQKLTRNRRAV